MRSDVGVCERAALSFDADERPRPADGEADADKKPFRWAGGLCRLRPSPARGLAAGCRQRDGAVALAGPIPTIATQANPWQDRRKVQPMVVLEDCQVFTFYLSYESSIMDSIAHGEEIAKAPQAQMSGVPRTLSIVALLPAACQPTTQACPLAIT